MGLVSSKGAAGAASDRDMAAAKAQNAARAYNYGEEKAKDTVKEFGKGGGDFSFDLEMKKSVDEIYRRPRSQAYLDIVASIDLLSATDEEIIERLREVVDEDTLEEFSEMSVEELLEELRLSFEEEMADRQLQMQKYLEPEILLGVISKCYIGGCDVHAIDNRGYILEHYNESQNMPEGMEIGRIMYHKNPNCNCIEVYNNCCRVIASDGSVTKYDLDGNKVD